jgi:hypothetical protein
VIPNRQVVVDAQRSTIVTICPSCFEENDTIYPWISEVILPGRHADAIGETPFLRRAPKIGEDKPSQRKAGRIDNVLVVADSNPLDWIPIEKQAVYFSGRAMSLDFKDIADSKDDSLPFPVKRRRPDYRSSSAKRLLPQLEVKIKELRNWAKKTAVVVGEDFFAEFGPMIEEPHISTAHLVWFVVKYELRGDRFVLTRGFSRMVKLESSVQAVIAAQAGCRIWFVSGRYELCRINSIPSATRKAIADRINKIASMRFLSVSGYHLGEALVVLALLDQTGSRCKNSTSLHAVAKYSRKCALEGCARLVPESRNHCIVAEFELHDFVSKSPRLSVDQNLPHCGHVFVLFHKDQLVDKILK